jgi:murein L,D-transpeptidase YafK
VNPLVIVIHKAARRLVLSASDAVHREFPVDLGKNSAVDKAIEGDHATPVGEFYICAKNPHSKFFVSLCLSYPNAEDAARGLANGLISAQEHAQIIEAIRLGKMPPQHTRLGGEIYIHGRGSAPDAAVKDWTRGCVALDNAAMQEVYDWAVIGTRVCILE